MPCDLLGAVCTSLCKSCSFSYNNKNNIIIVGDPKNLEAVQGLFNQGVGVNLPTLEDAVMKSGRDIVHIDEIRINAVPRPEEETLASKEMQDKIMFGALKVTQEAIKAFSSQIELSHQEEWAHYKAAEYLTQMELYPTTFNIQDRVERNIPISQKEYLIFQKKIEMVRRYGSLAASLWFILKNLHVRDEFDLFRLKSINLINQNQLKILNIGLVHNGHEALLGKDCFADIGSQFQSIFIFAAEKSDRSLLQKKSKNYVSWLSDHHSDHEECNLEHLRVHRIGSRQMEDFSLSANMEREYKQPEENQALNALLTDLRIENDSIPKEKEEGFAVLRAQILCHRFNINIQKVVDGLLNPQEISMVRNGLRRLNELQGAMQHIYHSIRRTIVPAELTSQHGFTPEAVKTFKNENIVHKEFITDLHSSASLVSLKVYALSILFNIADKLNFGQIERLNQKRNIGDWFSTERKITPVERTPSSTGSWNEQAPIPQTMPLPVFADLQMSSARHISFRRSSLNDAQSFGPRRRSLSLHGEDGDHIEERGSLNPHWIPIDPYQGPVSSVAPIQVPTVGGLYEKVVRRESIFHPLSPEIKPLDPITPAVPSRNEPKAFIVTVRPSLSGPPTTNAVSIPYTLSSTIEGLGKATSTSKPEIK